MIRDTFFHRFLTYKLLVVIFIVILITCNYDTDDNQLTQTTSAVTIVTGLIEYTGVANGDFAGWSVTDVGDVNNDGYDDLLIGAYQNDEGGNDAGQSYLILGRSYGQWGMSISLNNANASFIGEVGADGSGNSVSGVGDVNNDGYDDFLVAAYLNSEGDTRAGQTYLILGRPTNQWMMDLSLANVNASFIGETDSDWSGSSVSGAGDVNADGYDDFLISAYYNEEGGITAGQTYLILGRSSEQWSMDISLANANASFIGEVPGDYSGWSISGVGDVNNDGYDDLIIGANQNNEGGSDAGQAYLILGRPTNQWSMDISLADANASFIGEAAGDRAGSSVSGAGDVNGDGFDDIIISANGNDEGGTTAGQIYLILGRHANHWSMDISLVNANASYIGEHPGDATGYSVSGAGDVNADGYDDIIIGSIRNHDGGVDAGKSYLCLGRPSNQLSMDVSLTAADASFVGETPRDESGKSISSAGDVNADGYADLVIGSPFNGGSGQGKASLILYPGIERTKTQTTTVSDTVTETGVTTTQITISFDTTTETGPTTTQIDTVTETGPTITETDQQGTSTVETVFTSTTVQTEQKSEVPMSMIGGMAAMISAVVYNKLKKKP